MISDQFINKVTLLRDKIESFKNYPFSLDAVKDLETIEVHPKVTFFVGENGSGKSTLLEAIAVALGFNPEGGSRNFNFGTRESHSILHEYLKISRGFRRPRSDYFLRAESFFNVATEIEKIDGCVGGELINVAYGGDSLHEQSHGESFLSLITHRFREDGLYILDEPEAALSPRGQLKFLSRMDELVQKKSQFIIATHSPILMSYPNAWIYQCSADGLRRVNYKETDHYKMTRNFLENPDEFLKDILKSNN